MKKILMLWLVCCCVPTFGQNPAPTPGEADSTWPGVKLLVPRVSRIEGNRLLVIVQVFATPNAPESTLIGTPAVLPPNASALDRLRPLIPEPYSLQGSTMTEEKTKQQFSMLAPNPKGPIYRPSVLLGSLTPGESLVMSIQFPLPPPPAPDSSGKIPKQTVSLMLPKAKGPITGVEIPPVEPNTASP